MSTKLTLKYLKDVEYKSSQSCNIYVYINGLEYVDPILVHVTAKEKISMGSLFSALDQRVKLKSGFTSGLFDLNGLKIKDPSQLESNNFYVVSSNLNKTFQFAEYGKFRPVFLVPSKFSKHVSKLKHECMETDKGLLKNKVESAGFQQKKELKEACKADEKNPHPSVGSSIVRPCEIFHPDNVQDEMVVLKKLKRVCPLGLAKFADKTFTIPSPDTNNKLPGQQYCKASMKSRSLNTIPIFGPRKNRALCEEFSTVGQIQWEVNSKMKEPYHATRTNSKTNEQWQENPDPPLGEQIEANAEVHLKISNARTINVNVSGVDKVTADEPNSDPGKVHACPSFIRSAATWFSRICRSNKKKS